MKLARSASLAALLVLAARSIGGQEASSEQPVTPNTELYARLERAVISIQSISGRPLHPIVSDIAPAGGWGAGLVYSPPRRGGWYLDAQGIYTTNQYWLAEGIAGYQNRRVQIETFERGRDMTRLPYFGPGTNSNLFDRTNFRLRDNVVGLNGKVRVTPWLAVGGRIESLSPDVRPGKAPSIPSIEQRFLESQTPGLTLQPDHIGRFQGSVDIQLPAGPVGAFYQGTKSRVTYAFYDDMDLDQFTYQRFDVELQQAFSGFGPYQRLTLSGWVSTSATEAGQDVPFYLQPTLGGNSAMGSVDDDRLGSDGTYATLRGFRDLRFRDRNLLLVQAEYRVPLWGPIDATVFGDAGKVARVRSDLDFNDLRRDLGFSLSIMKGWETWARVDVGFGSGEGPRVFFALGDLTR